MCFVSVKHTKANPLRLLPCSSKVTAEKIHREFFAIRLATMKVRSLCYRSNPENYIYSIRINRKK